MSEMYLGAGSGAIRHHYDVGNDFWQVWLDPTMSYSCAMWEDPADDLESAQRRKLDFHTEQAGAAGAGGGLDMGFGWGAPVASPSASQTRLPHRTGGCGRRGASARHRLRMGRPAHASGGLARC